MADKTTREEYTFGQMLKRYREEAKVTQQEIADAAGLSKNYISALERGLHKCSAATFITYAKLCHASLDKMAGLENSSNSDNIFFQKLNAMSEEDKLRLLQIIELMR